MDTAKILQIEQIDAQTLLSKFNSLECALNELKKHISPKQSTIYLTRQEVADLLKVTPVTIWSWTKKGILTPHHIGRYVRYKESEVINAVTPMNN